LAATKRRSSLGLQSSFWRQEWSLEAGEKLDVYRTAARTQETDSLSNGADSNPTN
jgi:hypothetical protein